MKKVACASIFALMFVLAGVLAAVNKPNLHIYASEDMNVLAYGDFATTRVNSLNDAQRFLKNEGETLNLDDNQLVINRITPSISGNIYTFDQFYEGIEVYARSVKVSVDANGVVDSISSNFYEGISILPTPSISQDDAVQIAIDYLENEHLCGCDDHENSSVHALYNQGLKIFSIECQPVLSYVFECESGLIFVGADGSGVCNFVPLNRSGVPFATTQTDIFGESVELTVDKNESNGVLSLKDLYRNITVYDCNFRTSLSNTEITTSTGVFSASQVSTLNNVVKAFDFFADENNIGVSVKGIDSSIKDFSYNDAAKNKEITVRVYINFNMDNAFYAGGTATQNPYFVFGVDTYNRLNYAVAADVVAHEYQHAVNEYNAGLLYSNASGALDEALADLFGALVEGYEMSDDRFWTMGETLADRGSSAFRSIIDPEASGYRSTVFNQFPFCLSNNHSTHYNCDNGGVHLNSTIISHAYYRMHLYAVENGFAAFNKQNLSKALYLTVQRLTSNSNWKQFRANYEYSIGLLGLSEQDETELMACSEYGFGYVGIVDGKDAYTVRYGLTGDFTGIAPLQVTGFAGTEFTIPEANISAPNTIFIGWAEDAYETDRARVYFAGQTYQIPEKNITLYPIGVKIWNNISPSVWQGSGTQNDPYLIKNENDFATLAFRVNAHNLLEDGQEIDGRYFKLLNDLDLGLKEWYPIGMSENSTKIYLDGAFHKIENLKLSSVSTYQGLFGHLNGGVKNLGVKSGDFSVHATYVGVIVARLNGSISNCYNYISPTNGSGMAAGIVGKAENSLIENCVNYGEIKANAAINAALSGGIVAQADLKTRIVNCVNNGRVYGSQPAGIVSKVDGAGSPESGTGGGIFNCVNTGVIAFNSFSINSGGIAASVFAVNGYKIMGNKSVSAVSKSGTSGSLIGYLNIESAAVFEKNHVKFNSAVGNFTSVSGISLVEDLDLSVKNYYLDSQNWSNSQGAKLFDFDLMWSMDESILSLKAYQYWQDFSEEFEFGNGTKEKPFEISTAGQLAKILTQTEQYYYILTADIDLNGRVWNGAVINGGGFNGNGYLISNLTTFGFEYAALFNQAIDSLLENITLIDGNIKAFETAAGIAATTENTNIVNCAVEGGYIEGLKLAAGIVGELKGAIMSCANSAEVFGLMAGGIVGSIDDIETDDLPIEEENDDEETTASVTIFEISKSVNKGVIKGVYGGGILAVALGSADIVDCINLGSVIATNSSGILGLISASEGVINILGCKHDGELGENASSIGGVVLESVTLAVSVKIIKSHYVGNAPIHKLIAVEITTTGSHSVENLDITNTDFYADEYYFVRISENKNNISLYLLANNDYQTPAVVFLNESGEVLKIEVVNRGENALPPQIEPKESDQHNTYTLVWNGRYTNVNGNSFVSESYLSQARTYQITFETNGGNEMASVDVEFSEDYVPSEPVKSGFKFVGWYTDADLNTEFDGNVSSDITLYAKWEGIGCTCGTIDINAFIYLFVVMTLLAIPVLFFKKSKVKAGN